MLTVKKIIKNKLWITSCLSLIIILLIIPVLLSFYNSDFVEIPKGVYIKTGSRIFYKFIEKVKYSNGILVLGTSETGNRLNGNNYFSLLNRDSIFNRPVFTLGGAGRCANVYFPLIIDNPQAFYGLEIIYYINPIYWRKGLNSYSTGYFNRYVDSSFACYIKKRQNYSQIYDDFIKPEMNESNFIPFITNRYIENFKSIYYHDLNGLFKTNKIYKTKKININNIYDIHKINELKGTINSFFNVTDEFLSKNNPFPEVDTISSYQYDMLIAFIDLIKKYRINCKFYLGPYNEIYCNQKNPEFVKKYQKVIMNIKNILVKNNVDFIDGSNLSIVSGTFIDIQHISEYGAYLTALQIKEYYEKKY